VGSGAPIDELLDGMSEALLKDLWVPNEVSDQRRTALLPMMPALDWDDLMVSPQYMQALECFP
jgi:beta-N-acetylhexosaminidase